MFVKDAAKIWNNLRGIICVYKPAGMACEKLRSTLIAVLCKELNSMKVRPPSEYVRIEGNPSEELKVSVATNFADHPLVAGPRYQEQDLFVSWSNFLGRDSSGVLLLGIRNGTKIAKYIRENRPTRAYRIKGVLGKATENGFMDGKVIEKTTWKHVRQFHMDKLLSSMQASHQKKMFELCGVDMQSQTAYELAIQGPIRPADSKIPVIYGIKCVEFNPPEFTLEIQCVNEYQTYLRMLIHEIGTKLHSSAHCTGIKCIRHSYFTLDDALLMKHFTSDLILANMNMCNKVLDQHEDLMLQKSIALKAQ